MNEPQSIEKVLVKLYIEGDLYGDEPRDECVAEAKAAIEAMVREIIGEDTRYATDTVMQRFAEAITAGHLTQVDYKNQLRKEQRLRASKYNLKLEKE